MIRGIAEKNFFCVGQRPGLPRGRSHIEESRLQRSARRDEATGSEDDFVFNHRAVHDYSAYANQAVIAYPATMQHDTMTDRHILSYKQGKTARRILPPMGDMQHATVLDIGPGTNLDMIDIPAQHAHRPDGYIITEDDIADYDSRFIN